MDITLVVIASSWDFLHTHCARLLMLAGYTVVCKLPRQALPAHRFSVHLFARVALVRLPRFHIARAQQWLKAGSGWVSHKGHFHSSSWQDPNRKPAGIRCLREVRWKISPFQAGVLRWEQSFSCAKGETAYSNQLSFCILNDSHWLSAVCESQLCPFFDRGSLAWLSRALCKSQTVTLEPAYFFFLEHALRI